MKRSRRVMLLTMGVSALALTACSSEPAEVEAQIYSSLEDCVAKAIVTQGQCEQAFSAAVDVHDEDAPSYDSKRQCEASEGEGKCERAASEKGEPRYRPSFLAFMMLGSSHARSQPLYPAQNGAQGYRTASNVGLSSATGKVSVPTAATKGAGVTTVARGGFGTTAHASGADASG